MTINVNHDPPSNIPQLRGKYISGSIFFLALVACSVIIGIFSVQTDTAHTEIFENSAFVIFVVAGFAFVYFTEKLLEFRRPGPKRREKLVAMMYEYEEVAEYCRKVAEQGRHLVVAEYDAIVAHVQKTEGEKQQGKPGTEA